MTLARNLVPLLDAHIGRCPRCMRQAFLAASGFWVLAMLAEAAGAAAWALDAALLVAGGLTVLWIGHVAAFALRSALAASRMKAKAGSAAEAAAAPRLWSRRELAAEFARAAAFAAVATALSARAALACTQLPIGCSSNGDCTCSNCCGDLAGVHVCQPSC
jgi:hypothetical protein